MRSWNVIGVLCLSVFFVGCSADRDETEIRIVWGAPKVQTHTSMPDAFPGKTSTGLMSSGFCYALNDLLPVNATSWL
jgi:hypothetical protein